MLYSGRPCRSIALAAFELANIVVINTKLMLRHNDCWSSAQAVDAKMRVIVVIKFGNENKP